MTALLPHNYDAEKSVLSSVLMDRDAIVAIADFLKPEHFHNRHYGLIYAAAMRCFEQRTPPDLITVSAMLTTMNAIEQVGGLDALVLLSDFAPHSYHVEYYAKIVQEAAVRRALIDASQRIAQLAYSADTPIESLASSVQTVVSSAIAVQDNRTMEPIQDSVSRVFANLTGQKTYGIETNIRSFDRLTGGLHPSRLYLIAGMSGSGKTAFAGQLTYNLGRCGYSGIWFSLEMEHDELTSRLIANHAGVDAKGVGECSLSLQDLQRAQDACMAINELPVHVDESGSLTIEDIRLRALRHKAERGSLDWVVVDYLQLITPLRKGRENASLDVDQTARGLKQLAKELKAPVICISQINRAGQKRGDDSPQLYDLLYGGDKDADFVGIMQRADKDAPPEEQAISRLHVVKHRHGPRGVVSLYFDGASMRFAELEELREYSAEDCDRYLTQEAA